jgi:hypothetical protein
MDRECIGCPEDCSKVLVSSPNQPRQAIEVKVRDAEPEQPIKVAAYYESNGMKSEVKCDVNGDTIICGW